MIDCLDRKNNDDSNIDDKKGVKGSQRAQYNRFPRIKRQGKTKGTA